MFTVNAIKALSIFEIGGPTWYLNVVKLRQILGVDLLKVLLGFGYGSSLADISMNSFYHYAQNAE